MTNGAGEQADQRQGERPAVEEMAVAQAEAGGAGASVSRISSPPS